jgi:hypothetical protein
MQEVGAQARVKNSSYDPANAHLTAAQAGVQGICL